MKHNFSRVTNYSVIKKAYPIDKNKDLLKIYGEISGDFFIGSREIRNEFSQDYILTSDLKKAILPNVIPVRVRTTEPVIPATLDDNKLQTRERISLQIETELVLASENIVSQNSVYTSEQLSQKLIFYGNSVLITSKHFLDVNSKSLKL